MRVVRRTISEMCKCEGIGLHSGAPVTVLLHPSQSGLFFRSGADRWEAIPENVTNTTRQTRLGSISTIEHLMSALAGLGITDLEVEVNGPEMPAMEGCAAPWLGLLAGKVLDIGESERRDLFSRIWEKQEGCEIALSSGNGHWKYEFVAPEGRYPGTQSFEFFFSGADYAEAVAPARTTAFDFEVEAARAAGLGRGLDESSCLVLGAEGPVNTPRFSDEPARHKLLDLMGDLWLARVPLGVMNGEASRSGHTAHVAAAAKVLASVPLR